MIQQARQLHNTLYATLTCQITYIISSCKQQSNIYLKQNLILYSNFNENQNLTVAMTTKMTVSYQKHRICIPHSFLY